MIFSLTQYPIFIILSYLFGSIPFGLIIVKLVSNKDIRKEGSFNIGATNVARVVGKKYAILTFILDGLKGVLAIILVKLLIHDIDYTTLYFIALAAIIGHMFPIWLKFKGGKGVATSFAVYLILLPYYAIMIATIWILVFLVSRISALAALISMFSPVILSLFIGDFNSKIFCLVIFVLILIRHKSNIQRMMAKKENKFI